MNEFTTTSEVVSNSIPAVDSSMTVSKRSRAIVILDRMAGYADVRDREAAIVVICEELERAETYSRIEYLSQQQKVS
jgi:hypothetical protein